MESCMALCSRCQAASSKGGGMDMLQKLQQILAEEGRDRVQQEVQSVSRDVLREVSKAAHLPVAASDGRTMLVSELRSALLAYLLNQSEEQEEARCVETWISSYRSALEFEKAVTTWLNFPGKYVGEVLCRDSIYVVYM